MSGGIDWFRWHHGTAGDRKFPLVAKRAGARVGDVITMWAILLEQASASDDRGCPGSIDFESIDLALDMADGTAQAIHAAMVDRNLIDPETGRLVAWDKRQPKKEDETAAERKRRQREREHEMAVTEAASRHVTPRHAGVTLGHDREEESREEIRGTSNEVPCAQPAAEPPALALVERPKGPPECPHLEILDLWLEILPSLPQHDPKRWRGAKADHLRARWKETAVSKHWPDKEVGLAYFRRLFGYVARSDFLCGRAQPPPGRRRFVIELEWLVTLANWDKVHEGKYHEEAA